MYHIIQYLKHLITATNQHGVHSPFVYEFVTNCLYKKSYLDTSKSHQVLFKSIPFFSVESIKIIAKDSQIENQIQKELGLKTSHEDPFDLIYLDFPRADVLAIHSTKIHNNSFIVIENIHGTKKASSIWEALNQDELITFSIDLFHCGMLFFRKEQVKEHFKIRI